MYLVGGGAILAPDTLRGVSKVHRVPHYSCANAVGAAIAQVSGIVDTVETLEGRTVDEARREVESKALQRAIEGGANPATVSIVESESIPIAYTAGRCRFFVKAAGDWVGRSDRSISNDAAATSAFPKLRTNAVRPSHRSDIEWTSAAIEAYRPRVRDGQWLLSEIDLAWICTGTYILGCGGGGDPDHTFLAARELLRKGETIAVIPLGSLGSQDLIGWGGGMGSPEVASERLMSDEWVIGACKYADKRYLDATRKLYKFMGVSGAVGSHSAAPDMSDQGCQSPRSVGDRRIEWDDQREDSPLRNVTDNSWWKARAVGSVFPSSTGTLWDGRTPRAGKRLRMCLTSRARVKTSYRAVSVAGMAVSWCVHS